MRNVIDFTCSTDTGVSIPLCVSVLRLRTSQKFFMQKLDGVVLLISSRYLEKEVAISVTAFINKRFALTISMIKVVTVVYS
jgi:hypothetical protein